MVPLKRRQKKQRRLSMKERTALGEAILKHWRENCPQMVRDLEKLNRLDQTVFAAQEKAGDLLYELVSVRKMNYQAAWELAAEEWALPQSEDLPPTARPPSGRSRSRTSSRKWRPHRRRGTSG
jgi:hypothetical protein